MLTDFLSTYFQLNISLDSSGRRFAGKGNFPHGTNLIMASVFTNYIIHKDIQVKEGGALKETLQTLIRETPEHMKGTNVVCHIDQALLFWLQETGEFFLHFNYVHTNQNKADKYTRESPILETSINHEYFKRIWNK